MKRRTWLLSSLAAVARIGPPAGVLGLGACAGPNNTQISGHTMGTGYQVTLPELLSRTDTQAVRTRVEHALARVDSHMSTYRRDSDVAALRDTRPGTWVQVSGHTVRVVQRARQIHALSTGAFDPTVSKLVDLWGFGPPQRQGIPTAARIEMARAQMGLNLLEIDSGSHRLRNTQPGLALDLSGIAKGYAVDLVAAALSSAGCERYLVDVGGEIRARGKASGARPWHIGIERPVAGPRSVHLAVSLQDEAIATSGDYRNFFDHRGRHYSHTIDPRSGRPVAHHLASVSVIAADTMDADALSTALMVLGPDDGFDLARRLGLAALFSVRDPQGVIRSNMTDGFAERLLG